jgi:hypothetical protein
VTGAGVGGESLAGGVAGEAGADGEAGAAEGSALGSAAGAFGAGDGLDADTTPDAVGSGAAKGVAVEAPALPEASPLPDGDAGVVLSALMGGSVASPDPQAATANPMVTSARARLAWSIRVFDMGILSRGVESATKARERTCPVPRGALPRGARCVRGPLRKLPLRVQGRGDLGSRSSFVWGVSHESLWSARRPLYGTDPLLQSASREMRSMFASDGAHAGNALHPGIAHFDERSLLELTSVVSRLEACSSSKKSAKSARRDCDSAFALGSTCL